MKYLVILEPGSTTGKMYADSNDGLTNDGGVKCPVLACTDVSFDSPHYILVERGGSQAKTRQSLYLPYHSVVHILKYALDDPHPFGFLPPPEPAE